MSPIKGHKDDEGTGAYFKYGEAKRHEAVLPGEVKAHEDLISMYKS